MKKNGRDKKNLLGGVLLLVAGAFFVFAGLTGNGENGARHEDGGTTDDSSAQENVVLIPNNGGELEGHTPRGFSGLGTGLFIGDNLNPGFPNGDGVQMFLTFDIEELSDKKTKSAVLVSDFVNITGTPFSDLGAILVNEVNYTEFSAKSWNIEVKETVCTTESVQGTLFSCDVTDYVNRILREGETKAQLVLYFEKVSDGDSSPDLVFFYKKDSNTNESGIFNLRINDEADQEPALPISEAITIPIVLHRVVDSGNLSTSRTTENITELFEDSKRIWSQANIKFDVKVVDTVVPEDIRENIERGEWRALQTLTINEPLSFHTYFFKDIGGPNGIAFPPLFSVIADVTTVPDFRATAHEIGHLLGLGHTKDSRGRLLYSGTDGETLVGNEIKSTREYAKEFEDEIVRRKE